MIARASSAPSTRARASIWPSSLGIPARMASVTSAASPDTVAPCAKNPRPGDLVFFRNTTARRGFTHVGIVESARGGEIAFVHRAGGGIVRSRLDLRRPHQPAHNDFIKRSGPRPRLARELVAGFASPDPFFTLLP